MEFIGLFLEKGREETLYAQLYQYLVGEIRAGRLKAGERLPGKRTAAAQLGVSINTVDEAYQMLAAEGYVEARPRSGFAVCRLEQLVPQPGAGAAAGRQAPPAREYWQRAEEPAPAQPPAEGPAGPGGRPLTFSSSGLDLGLFPHKTWNRLLRETLAGDPGLFGQGAPNGDEALRLAVAEYLRGYRGVQCTAGQIVVGAGLEVLLGMLARLAPYEVFAVEDPGYPKTMAVLKNMGVQVQPVPIDAAGMPVEALERIGARVAYLTPSHQFPTGQVMPVGRRTELLQWAARGGRWIIEDDYDSEFRFDGRPLPSMQGLDGAGRVVYAGTFSRALAPGLRAAYLVLPGPLLDKWQKAYGRYSCTVSRPEQHTLARLMAEGHFARSLNRMRGAYRRRRDSLLQALKAGLPAGSWRAENTHTGLYMILRLPGQNAAELARRARQGGVRLHALDEYRSGRALGARSEETADALVLGYGGLAEDGMEAAAAVLAGLMKREHSWF